MQRGFSLAGGCNRGLRGDLQGVNCMCVKVDVMPRDPVTSDLSKSEPAVLWRASEVVWASVRACFHTIYCSCWVSFQQHTAHARTRPSSHNTRPRAICLSLSFVKLSRAAVCGSFFTLFTNKTLLAKQTRRCGGGGMPWLEAPGRRAIASTTRLECRRPACPVQYLQHFS